MSEPTRLVASAPTEKPLSVYERYGKMPGESWAVWGARTGRYRYDRVPVYQKLLDEEARRIKASGGHPGVSEVAGMIVGLVQMVADDTDGRIMASGAPDNRPFRTTVESIGYTAAAAAAVAEPRLSRVEQLERDLWGPTREQRWGEQDRAAERELAEHDERQRIAASSALTDDEYRQLFGDQ